MSPPRSRSCEIDPGTPGTPGTRANACSPVPGQTGNSGNFASAFFGNIDRPDLARAGEALLAPFVGRGNC